MQTRYGLFIDGEERPSASTNTFPVMNPFDGSVVGLAARGDEMDVATAVATKFSMDLQTIRAAFKSVDKLR